MRWFSPACPVVARKNVLTCFKAENGRSLAAFFAAIANSNLPSKAILGQAICWNHQLTENMISGYQC